VNTHTHTYLLVKGSRLLLDSRMSDVMLRMNSPSGGVITLTLITLASLFSIVESSYSSRYLFSWIKSLIIIRISSALSSREKHNISG